MAEPNTEPVAGRPGVFKLVVALNALALCATLLVGFNAAFRALNEGAAHTTQTTVLEWLGVIWMALGTVGLIAQVASSRPRRDRLIIGLLSLGLAWPTAMIVFVVREQLLF